MSGKKTKDSRGLTCEPEVEGQTFGETRGCGGYGKRDKNSPALLRVGPMRVKN